MPTTSRAGERYAITTVSAKRGGDALASGALNATGPATEKNVMEGSRMSQLFLFRFLHQTPL